MAKIDWQQIDTVILDLDGTLIDLYFDHYFWKHQVPMAYAQKFQLSLEQSRQQLKQRYDAIEFSMNWYCLDFWAKTLDLPLRELLTAQAPFVKVRSDVFPFLKTLRKMGKKIILLTDSHPFSLQVKLNVCELAPYFDLCLSSHTFNAPKVEQTLWHNLQAAHYFNPGRTLFIDDTQKVLDSAKQFGIAYTIGVENPDSTMGNNRFENHLSTQDYRSLIDTSFLQH